MVSISANHVLVGHSPSFVSKIAAITKNIILFKWSKHLYFELELPEI